MNKTEVNKKYPSQAELLSSIQEATISLTRINLSDDLIKSLSKIDSRIHSLLDCAHLDLIIE